MSLSLSLFHWVWTTSIKASVLIILLLLVKFVLKNKIGARTHYLLWGFVIISLLLPWTPQSSFSVYNLAKLDTKPSSIINEGVNASLTHTFTDSGVSSELATTNSLQEVAVIQNNPSTFPKPNASPHQRKISLISKATSPFTHRILFFIWIAGICVFVFATAFVHNRFRKGIKGQFVNDTKLLSVFHEAKEKLNIRGTVPLLLTHAVKTPSLFGFFHPKLLLPIGVLDDFSPAQLNHVFIHELLHLKRKDILVNWLTRALLIVHWFNPIIWYSFMKIREEQELACDALALSRMGENQAIDYAHTLIKLLESYSGTHHLANLACLSGKKSLMKRRLTMLKMVKQYSVKWTMLGLVVLILIAVTTLTTAKADTTNRANQTSSTATEAPSIEASLTPISLNQALVDQVKTQFAKVKYFSYSSETDIASIAYGRMLTIMANDKLHISNALPTRPIFVKSYDKEVRDYYIVPFVSDNKYAATAIVMTYADGTAGDGEAIIYPLEKRTDKYFALDANKAQAIVRKTQNIKDVPIPTLAFIPIDSSNRLESPFWEFQLVGEKKIYVNQSNGQVVESYVPPVDPSSNSIKRFPVPGENWSVAVTRLILNPGINTTNKLAKIYLTLSNNDGEDKTFLPTGKIVGYVGISGKVYQASEPYTLDEEYQNGQEYLKEKAQKYGTAYQPGLITLVREELVDGSEKGISKLIYQDENGKKIEIPI